MARTYSRLIIVVIVLGLFVFWLKASSFLDPDFGWQLRTGQIILSAGIPRTDPFSYTMPNYPYVDHSWLTDVALAKLFPLIGFSGLAVIFSLLTILSTGIVFSIKKSVSDCNSLTLLLLLATVFLVFVTIRPLVLMIGIKATGPEPQWPRLMWPAWPV